METQDAARAQINYDSLRFLRRGAGRTGLGQEQRDTAMNQISVMRVEQKKYTYVYVYI